MEGWWVSGLDKGGIVVNVSLSDGHVYGDVLIIVGDLSVCYIGVVVLI